MGRPPIPVGAHGAVGVVEVSPGRHRARTRQRGEDGVTRLVEATGPSAAAARRALSAALARREHRGGDEITGATRLSVVVERWLAEVQRSGRASGTKRTYSETARRYVTPRVGALLVRECSVPRLERFTTALAQDVGPSTSKLARTVLTGALGLAVRHGALPVNPVREVPPVRSVRREVRAPSPEEVRELRADLAGDERAVSVDLPALVDVMLGTAARIGEALALRWVDVDLDAGTVVLTGTVVRVADPAAGTSTLVRQSTTKGHRARALAVPAFTVEALRAQRDKGWPGGEHDLVFPSVRAGLREVSTVEKQWRAWRGRHPRWSALTTHSCRKAVATAVEREAGMATAAAVLGHSSERVTAAHYVEVAPMGPDVRGVLERFASVSDG